MIFLFILPLLTVAYCSWHVWTLLPLPRLWRTLIIFLGIGSFLLIFLNIGRGIDRMPMTLARLSYEIGNSSIFVMLYMTIIFLVLDLGRLLHIVPKEWMHHNGYTSAAIAIGLFAIFLYGNIHYYNKQRETLHLTTSKELAHPQRLVMMSDLHLGYHNPRSELRRWVDMLNNEHPDAVLIAGDIIDMSMRPLFEENMAEELRRISAPVYACIGNHEYFAGEPMAQQFYKDAGIMLLRDTCTIAGDLLIIGRDDRSNPRRKSLEKMLSSQPTDRSSKYTILLDHQPFQLEQAEKAGIDFQFSGHTHRGQLWPISWITDRIYECSHGRWQRGNTSYYVSSGIGIWGGKFRIGTQSEYIVAEITNNNQTTIQK